MEDRSNEIISQYDMRIYRSYRARGGMVLETDQGLKFLSPCRGSERRLEFEDTLKQQLIAHGYQNLDRLMRNREEKLISSNSIGEKYCIRDWFELEECSLKREESILLAAENLALLHLAMSGIRIPQEGPIFVEEDLGSILERRSKEMKRVKSYLTKRKNKTAFEICYLNCCSTFLTEAARAAELLVRLDTHLLSEESLKFGRVIHGSYTYHNILMESQGERSMLCAAETVPAKRAAVKGAGEANGCSKAAGLEKAKRERQVATVNFDKSVFGLQIGDLYQFLRKVMEKNGWQFELGCSLLTAYERVRALSDKEKQLILVLLSYPEKFWKITNYYYNSRKSMIPQKNMDKLETLLAQQAGRRDFLQRLCQLWGGVI